jgi:hypothetical protein
MPQQQLSIFAFCMQIVVIALYQPFLQAVSPVTKFLFHNNRSTIEQFSFNLHVIASQHSNQGIELYDHNCIVIHDTDSENANESLKYLITEFIN